MKLDKKQFAALAASIVIFSTNAETHIVIDGILSESEWQNTQVFDSYIQSFPNTGTSPNFPTTTYLHSDYTGIYIAFKNYQPIRSRKYSGHDQYTSADFNMVFIDFNNDGDTAYEFVATLGGGTMDGTYSRGNQASRDWDGKWQVSVSEQGNYWYSEFFIPWTTASFQTVSGNKRLISVYFQRQNVVEGQAYSFPDTNRGRKNFTYEFYPVTVNNTQSQSLNTSTYMNSTYNVNTKENSTDIGMDVIWKPSSNQQLIATVNPDFGQVESDELIVNYSAVETLRTDKRPFFTENQSLFDVQGTNNLKLVNTRRIGANAINNTDKLHDINAAAKYVYNHNNYGVGLLMASEGDADNSKGKDFASLRWYSSLKDLNFGQLVNYVKNPINNRSSLVVNHDVNYRFNGKLNVSTNFLYSNNKEDTSKKSGKGATFKTSYVPARNWQNNIEWSYFDDRLNVNDFGYMQRNNISTFKINSQYDNNRFDINSPFLRSRSYGEYQFQRNTQGLTLRDSIYLSYFLGLKSKHLFRVGVKQTNSGDDDLITRQLGKVSLPKQKEFHIYYASPTPAEFSFNTRLDYFQEGQSKWASKLQLNTTTYFTDSVRLNANYTYMDSDDWLIGNTAGQVKRYSRKLNKLYAKLITRLSNAADMTITSQWYGLKASGIHTNNPQYSRGEDFNISRFALQARYRHRFSNGASFYLVYSHNGFDDTLIEDTDFEDLLSNAISNPAQESITAKLNWIF